ncbi:MAG: hypothetical protein ACTS5A_03815, partial [Candidatus Hodgkinia cicadicola]
AEGWRDLIAFKALGEFGESTSDGTLGLRVIAPPSRRTEGSMERKLALRRKGSAGFAPCRCIGDPKERNPAEREFITLRLSAEEVLSGRSEGKFVLKFRTNFMVKVAKQT